MVKLSYLYEIFLWKQLLYIIYFLELKGSPEKAIQVKHVKKFPSMQLKAYCIVSHAYKFVLFMYFMSL